MKNRDRTHILALLALASGVPTGLGQPTEVPPQPPVERPDARLNPALTDLSLLESMEERTTRPDVEGALLPTVAAEIAQVVPNQQSDAGVFLFADGSRGWVDALTLLPEGTFLFRRLGEVVRLRTGGLAFLPVRQEGSTAEPAMPLMACEAYGRLAALMEGTERGLWLNVTGEVFEYQGRNYLLPSAFATEVGGPQQVETETQPTEEAVEPPDLAEPAEPGVDPRIDDLVRELEAQRAERKGIETTFPIEGSPGEGQAAPVGPRIEGRMLFSRRGRMVRSAAGGWVVAIDNDPDAGAAAPVLPERLRLLPCRIVGAMERLAESRGESWSFEVSGNLYRHGEAVYLLPRMFVTQPRGEVGALQ